MVKKGTSQDRVYVILTLNSAYYTLQLYVRIFVLYVRV